jgi:small-conductance mechanosensitive channel
LTIILASFAIIHGFYHLSYLVGWGSVAPFIDLGSALILVLLGMYYSNRIISASLFLIALPDVASDLVPIALIIALVIFVSLAIKSKSIRSLQAQLSIFLIIWIVAELLRALLVIGLISTTPALELLGFEIHTASMVLFGLFLLVRFYVVTSRATSSKGSDAPPPEWLTKETGSKEGSAPKLS